jgi:hypothetical protein
LSVAVWSDVDIVKVTLSVFRGRAGLPTVAVPFRSSVRFPLLIEHQNHAQNTPYPLTAEERSERAKKASIAAAKKRTADRLERERAAKKRK